MATIDDARDAARGLPRSHEAVVGRRVKFRVGRIVYAAFSRDESLMGFAFPRELRAGLVESEPEKFLMPTGGDLRYNWVVARLGSVDRTEVHQLVLDAWAFCVPKDVAAEHRAAH